ncbi:MAG TPA: tetratricopeptide repeat protein, partial [Acidobacteriaceae bacterium]|nr:tetratricopeptide repeat protein [Acidobacteriaceae bacterium]
MMKACVTRVWLPAILLAGLLLGTPADKLLAQPSGATAPPAPSATKTSVDSRKTQLARAAKLADVGKYSAAMAIYRQLFGTHPPPGEVAVAYYETEAATDGGRPQAEQGLRALVEKYPAETRYQVSLGRVLIYDPATRAEGRAYLAKFPDDPQAEQAMRESLLWDAANPAVAPQIRAYLAAHPDPQLVAVFQVAQPEAAKAGTIVTPGNTSTAAAETGQPSSERIVVTPASSRAAAADSQASATQTASVSGISSAPPTAGSPGASADTLPTAPTPAKKPAASPSIAAGPSPVAAPLPMSVEAKPIATSSPRASASAPASAPIRLVSPGTEKPGVPAGGETAAEVAAYQALNANRIDEAESRFQAILSAEPRNEKALAGMGYVRMQQGKFPGAIEYLEQAKQSDATGSIPDKGLQGALDTARFWFGMGEAQKAFAAGDLT